MAFTDVLKKAEIAISMDGRGAWRDNVFVERLWRTIKYEQVYLRAYDSVSESRALIGRYLEHFVSRLNRFLDSSLGRSLIHHAGWVGGQHGCRASHDLKTCGFAR